MPPPLFSRTAGGLPSRMLIAGLVAGTAATLAQLLLWWWLEVPLPETLYRDIRLTAAIVMPADIIAPRVLHATPALAMLFWASLIHGLLSLLYAAAFNVLSQRAQRRQPWPVAGRLGAGILFGVALYLINMYGFTLIWPWFAWVRDGITLSAHAVFGLVLALLVRPNTRPIAPLLPI